jgi:ABC-type multidrug transport system fused ATPase/permease subunit
MELDWLVSQALNKSHMHQASLLRLLALVFLSRPFWRGLILLSSLVAAIFGLMAPFFQKQFVDYLTGHQSLQTPLAAGGILPALLFSFVCLLISLSFNVLTNFLGNREAIIMQGILSRKLYDHALKLRTDSLGGKSVGEIVQLYATDIPGATVFLEQSLPVGASILFPFVLAPAALIFLFHIPLWPLFSVMGSIVGLCFFMAFLQSKFFFQFKKLAGERIGIVSEWVQNIRTLRILGWVEAFEEKIFYVRRVETLNRIKMVTNGQAMNSISSSVTFLLNIVVIVSLIYYSQEKITTGSLMAMMWIVAVFLTKPFRQMPWFFTFVFDSWTSLKRIDSFLKLDNQDAHIRPSDFLKLKSLAAPELAIQIENLNLSIAGNSLLRGINLDIKLGEFVTIVGEVGSGKSLLLLSLLGETGASFKKYLIGSNNALTMPLNQLRQFFTFVPQEGFIMSATLRENVAFDYNVNGPDLDAKILRSLEHCQFRLATERIENGLDTDIGERGVNLSGGQKQRVSLARVDYYESPIVFMDDCLSAVDVDTENKLIEGLIKGAWKDRTRLLVTHRLTVLEKSDRVIFLHNGEIKGFAPFQNLLTSSEEFRSFVATVAQTSQIQRKASADETDSLS